MGKVNQMGSAVLTCAGTSKLPCLPVSNASYGIAAKLPWEKGGFAEGGLNLSRLEQPEVVGSFSNGSLDPAYFIISVTAMPPSYESFWKEV